MTAERHVLKGRERRLRNIGSATPLAGLTCPSLIKSVHHPTFANVRKSHPNSPQDRYPGDSADVDLGVSSYKSDHTDGTPEVHHF